MAQDVEHVSSGESYTKELSEAMPTSANEEHKGFTNDEQSSTRSDAANEDSPRLRHHSLFVESGESSHDFDHSKSVLSLHEEVCLNEELLQRAYVFPKTEDVYCHPHATSCGYGFSVEDHAFNFW